MSLFIAETVEQIDRNVEKNSALLAVPNDSRIFFEITLAQGSPVWITRSDSAAKGKGVLLVGIGASFRCENWKGAISVTSEGQSRITGEVGYA